MAGHLVLLVDDEEDILQSVAEYITATRPGVQVMTATSARQGLEVLAHHAVDVVVSDLRMPQMDGMTFLRAVEERFPKVQRILMTAFTDERLKRQAAFENMDGYLEKPLDTDEMACIAEMADPEPELLPELEP